MTAENIDSERRKAWIRWIAAFVAKCGGPKATLGKCERAAKLMAQEFPELRVAKGHVLDACWGQRGHWWCIAPDGTVVDPTVGQFPNVLRYDEFKEGDNVRIGACANCGDDLWRPPGTPHPTVCSEDCRVSYVAYLNGGPL